MTATNSTAVDLKIYKKSGSVDKHLEGVKKQYDTSEKLAFYEQVMGDGMDNIHFGKWDNISLDQEGAYGKASEQMTDYMFDLGRSLLKSDHKEAKDFKYVDLGSGTGAAAFHQAACLNLCQEQNALAKRRAADLNLSECIRVKTGTYEDANMFQENEFDLAFSQDAFVHAFSKTKAYTEALRIVKPSGALVFCDLMCGLMTFAQTNMVNDWLSPKENIKAAEAARLDGSYVRRFDSGHSSFLSAHAQKGGQDDCRKAANDSDDSIDSVLLTTYKENLAQRVTQVDRGVFKWGVIHAKKLPPSR